MNCAWSAFGIYPQSQAKSSQVSVSAFSPSASVNLLKKCASYLRFPQASRRVEHTERDEGVSCPLTNCVRPLESVCSHGISALLTRKLFYKRSSLSLILF